MSQPAWFGGQTTTCGKRLFRLAPTHTCYDREQSSETRPHEVATRLYQQQRRSSDGAAVLEEAMRTKSTTQELGHAYPVEQAVRYWMRTPVITVTFDAPLCDALALMREHDVRRLPVVLDTGELCGMITQGDIRGADVPRLAGLDALVVADALRQVKVYEVMAERPLSVTP